MPLAICLAVAVVAPIVMLAYPIPQIRGGWCQSGGRPGHYTVETVAIVALWCETLAVAGVVLLLAGSRKSWAGRESYHAVLSFVARYHPTPPMSRTLAAVW